MFVLAPVAGVFLASAASAQFSLEATPAITQSTSGEIVFRDYPGRALAANEQGKVGFAVKSDAKGFPMSCQITSSSGYPLLDSDTCRLLMVHATFKPLDGAATEFVNTGVVNWKIDPWLVEARQQTATKKKPTPRWGWSRKTKAPKNVELTSASGETQICKKVPRTGNLAAFDRICRTKADWAKTSEQNGFWADQQGRRGSSVTP
ncbi:energy transducer TonB [Sphingomonas lutea]|nr:energy transducer TonB [Sphingomonas lutea]